jgi:glycosyltransferase involved in cell wall biosynthesis
MPILAKFRLLPASFAAYILRANILSPKGKLYRILRFVFFKLPYGVREKIKRPVDVLVAQIGDNHLKKKDLAKNSNPLDISWSEFDGNILSNRHNFKGVFIQELVIDWNVPLYQRPQHIASALGKLGYLVIYRTDNWAGDDVEGFREVAKNVWITNNRNVDRIPSVVRSIYSTAYANSPKSIEEGGQRGVLIYEYIDHIHPEISGEAENIKRLADIKKYAFTGGADFIVASAKNLYQEAVQAVGEEKVILIPNGVDTNHYRNSMSHQIELPKKFLEFGQRFRVIVGYFGALAPWLWYECIKELAITRADIGFIFIGPDYFGGAEKLPKQSNVLRLDAVNYKILPLYAREFDVCFIPFKPGEIAKSTSPLKLFEYFAMEKPVVVTADMNECIVYEEVFKGGSAVELSTAIDEAIKVKDQRYYKERLRNLADENDWLQRAKSYEICFRKV